MVGVPARMLPHSSTAMLLPDGVNLRSPMGDTVWRVAATVMAGVWLPVEPGVVEPEVPDDEPVLFGVVEPVFVGDATVVWTEDARCVCELML